MNSIVESAIGEVYMSAIPGIYNCFLTTVSYDIKLINKSPLGFKRS